MIPARLTDFLPTESPVCKKQPAAAVKQPEKTDRTQKNPPDGGFFVCVTDQTTAMPLSVLETV